MIALIPCRAGSQRVKRKNFKPLAGKPLLAHTYEAAAESGVFDAIAFCSDDIPQVLKLIKPQGPPVHFLQQSHPLHQDDSCDITWVSDALRRLPKTDEFAILRPTSPFRDAETIKRAKAQWGEIKENYDSMRAIRKCSEHPFKQHQYDPETHELWPWMKAAYHQHLHSRPTQSLAESWVQTAGLEFAWTRTPLELGTIAGDRIAGFEMDSLEGLDINGPHDWLLAETLAAAGVPCP